MTEETTVRDNLVLKSADIFELAELNSFLKDDRIEELIDHTLNVVARPNVPKEKAAALVAKYQGMSVYCKTKAMTYGYVLGANARSDNSKKKSIYNTLAKEFHEMAQSMKYLVNV